MLKYKDFGHGLRLGNYLFNLAFLTYAANKSNTEIQYKKDYFLWKYLENPPVLTDDFNYQEELILPHTLYFGYDQNRKEFLIEHFKTNNDKIINISPNANFQSELWFCDNVEFVKSKLFIKDSEKNRVYKKYKRMFSKPTIGIGIRRGDFVNHGSFYQIPDDWYIRALESNFPNWRIENNIVIFSDDIQWCKQRYKHLPFYFAEPNDTHLIDDSNYYKDPMEQFILGTLMSNFIGGSSTFTWWQMWYVKNFNNGKVVHTGKNLTDGPVREGWINNDYYPKSWILYEV